MGNLATNPKTSGTNVGKAFLPATPASLSDSNQRWNLHRGDSGKAELVGKSWADLLDAPDRAALAKRTFFAELPAFVNAIKDVFAPADIRAYLDHLEQEDPLTRLTGHGQAF